MENPASKFTAHITVSEWTRLILHSAHPEFDDGEPRENIVLLATLRRESELKRGE